MKKSRLSYIVHICVHILEQCDCRWTSFVIHYLDSSDQAVDTTGFILKVRLHEASAFSSSVLTTRAVLTVVYLVFSRPDLHILL